METVRQNLKAFGARLRTRWKLSTAIIGVTVYVVDSIVSNSLTGSILPAIWRAFVTWAARPTGVTGVVLALIVGAAVVWAALDPVGVWQRRQGHRAQLDAHEFNEVEQFRQMWFGDPADACEQAIQFSAMCERHFDEYRQNGFAKLLWYPREALFNARKMFDEALNPDNRKRLSEVQSRLNDLVLMYYRVAAWTTRAIHVDPSVVTNGGVGMTRARFRDWETRHKALARGIVHLRKRSMNTGKLTNSLDEELLAVRFHGDVFQIKLDPGTPPPAIGVRTPD